MISCLRVLGNSLASGYRLFKYLLISEPFIQLHPPARGHVWESPRYYPLLISSVKLKTRQWIFLSTSNDIILPSSNLTTQGNTINIAAVHLARVICGITTLYVRTIEWGGALKNTHDVGICGSRLNHFLLVPQSTDQFCFLMNNWL